MATFEKWSRENLEKFAYDASSKMQEQAEKLCEQQRQIKDLQEALKRREDDWK